MKEKIKKIMVQGGFSVIIAVVAMSLYLTVMYFSNKYFESQTKPAVLTVTEDGKISVSGFEKEENEVIYILWETDGGNIKPAEKNELFKEQWEDENNKWYYVNTEIDESIIWNSSDADGLEYTTANVRAIVYSYEASANKDQYYMGNYVNQMNITVTVKDGKIVQANESRYFSNPVRSGDDSDWSQIYVINESDDGKETYRYRTGKKIKDEILFLCWESDDKIINETKYEMGLYPECLINSDNKENNILVAKDTITIDKNKSDEKKISAFLIDEDTYDGYMENKKIEGKKKNIASFEIKGKK